MTGSSDQQIRPLEGNRSAKKIPSASVCFDYESLGVRDRLARIARITITIQIFLHALSHIRRPPV